MRVLKKARLNWAPKESNRIQAGWVRERMNTDILPPTRRAVTSRPHALPNTEMYFGFRSTDASSLHYDILIGFVVGEVCNTCMVKVK
jgi:hypothetical protein